MGKAKKSVKKQFLFFTIEMIVGAVIMIILVGVGTSGNGHPIVMLLSLVFGVLLVWFVAHVISKLFDSEYMNQPQRTVPSDSSVTSPSVTEKENKKG